MKGWHWKTIAAVLCLVFAATAVPTGNSKAMADIGDIKVKGSDLLQAQPETTYPGDVIFVRSKQVTAVTMFQATYKLRKAGDEYVRFIPIPIDVKPGVYALKAADQKTAVNITVAAKTFANDSITVSKQMNNMRQNTKRIEADQVKINKARSQSNPEPYFTSKFIVPVDGTLTTPYGYQRIVNGKLDSRHLAIDIANKTGTPVKASNDGKVVLADSIYLTGNTVIIDHGINLFSFYGHMSKLHVKAGQMVKQGDVIGEVGTTGFSTGPHLHYGMLIGNTYINPNPFFAGSPYEWKK